MAVRAYKIVEISGTDYRIEHSFNCGVFDLMTEGGTNEWTEIWRDCDIWVNRQTEYPYASGPRAHWHVENTITEESRHRAYFLASDDTFTSTLDLSDTNDGVLPSDVCRWMEIYQNGKKLPCEGYSVDPDTSVVTISSDWRVPGASYEVIFWAAPVGGSNPGS